MLYYNQRCSRWEINLPAYGKPLFITFKKLNPAEKLPLIAKAVGYKKNSAPQIIYDLSAGLGQDAYILYQLGYKLTLIERSDIIYFLLKDGLKQAGCELMLINTDARNYLEYADKSRLYPDIIYFDPIFPERSKQALPNKNTQILRKIAGEDNDAAQVFELALKSARQRVVVKRGLYSPLISDKKPDISYKAKTIRFDVYLTI